MTEFLLAVPRRPRRGLTLDLTRSRLRAVADGYAPFVGPVYDQEPVIVEPSVTTVALVFQRTGGPALAAAEADRWGVTRTQAPQVLVALTDVRLVMGERLGLRTDDDAVFDAEVVIDATKLAPFVTWGTNPGQGLPLTAAVPDPEQMGDDSEKDAAASAIEYMGLSVGQPLKEIAIDTVFLGSCTNGRLEDLRAAADVLRGRKVADSVRMLVVPGSAKVRLDAEAEGLDAVFTDAGAEWRLPGCSMCLGMNPDTLAPGERSASTSNRNFEGRQGPGGRTHLVSPQVAAATAVTGYLSSPADLD